MVMRTERPYKLLVVDDEEDVAPMFRQSMRRDVRQGRYELLFAGSGVEALERLEREPDVDMVITDINMPGMDGLELLEQLSQSPRDLRSVVLSAYGDMRNIRAAMGLGAVDFVIKPVDFDDMRGTIERTLTGLEQWREALSQRDELLSLRRELDLAGRIQQSVLPAEFPVLAGYGFHALMEPAREVAGDFYDVVQLDGGLVGVAVADVSDKGVPAALLMMAVRTMVRGAAIGLGDPARVLGEVNRLVCSQNPQSMFVTACFCVLDPARGLVEYASAGHPPLLVVRADGSVATLEPPFNMALGLTPSAGYGMHSASLGPGETMFMYTDGVTEAMDVSGARFGDARLLDVLSGAVGLDARGVVDLVVDAVRGFSSGRDPSDDVACVAVRREA